MRKVTALRILNAISLLIFLSCLVGCSTPTYEVLRTHASASDISLAAVTEISAKALERMGYEVRTIHDTGYVSAVRPAYRFFASCKMSVWVKMDSQTGVSLRVECKAIGCLDCREREQMELFYDTFYELAESHGYGGVASISYSPQIESSVSGESLPLALDRQIMVRVPGQKRRVSGESLPLALDRHIGLPEQRLGVSVLKLTPELRTYIGIGPDAQGVIIAGASPKSAAGRSGLQRGDVITRVDQTPISDPGDLANVKRLSSEFVKVTIYRAGKTLTKRIALDSGEGALGNQKTSHIPSQPSPLKEAFPSVQIHKIETKPFRISAGSEFDLGIEYTVSDPNVKEDEIPIKLSYRIFDGTKVFLSKPVEVKSLNGRRTPATLHLTATKKTGLYTIQALLNYKNQISERSTELKIE